LLKIQASYLASYIAKKMNEYDNREKKEYKITALKIPKPLHTEIKKIAAREGRDMKDIFTEQLEKYAKIHGEGNP